MSFVNPVLPRFIVKNISTSDVLILDKVKIRPGQELDIYERMEYGERQELTNRILQGLEMPDGSIYVLWKIKKKIEIVSFLNPSYQGSGLGVGSIQTKNPYFEGAVLGIDGGELAWLSAAGSSPPSGPAGGDLAGSYPNPVLNPTGVDAGTYGNSITIPSIQVGYDGRIISALDVPVVFPTTANPVGTAGGANVTLANASIESPPNTIDYWGKELWLHNVDNNRTITLPFFNNGSVWVEGNVNLVLQPKSMVKFIWTSRGSGGTWAQSCKAIQAG